jgi:phosphate starvation-inducible protein PhoH
LLTRICHGSKMVFCGDGAQIDLKDRKSSGFDVVCKHMKDVPGFEVITLEKNHRHEIVEYILDIYKILEHRIKIKVFVNIYNKNIKCQLL